VNSACNTRASPTGCFTFSILAAWRSCCWAGTKTGDDRWYEKNVPLADQIYNNYLAEMEEENDAKDDKVQ
jgi:hypothetical protein